MKGTTMKTTILIIALFTTTICLAGWERTYGGSDYDYGYSVAQTSDDGYIVAGITTSFGAGATDVYLVKTDAVGDTIWTRTNGGSDGDDGYSVAQTSDGGYIVAGRTSSFGAGFYDVYLVKTDGLGDTLWTRTYGGSDYDVGSSVAQTSDGGYIVAGLTQSFGAGGTDVYLVKTDAVGDTIWTRTYGGSDGDWGASVAQTSDGGYIVAGYTYSFGAGLSDVYLVKTDSVGDTMWTRTYGGSKLDWGYSVAQTSDGGYIVAGLYDYDWEAETGGDVYLVKTDSLGDTIWTRTYGGSGYDYGYSVAQTSDGGYIVAGRTLSFGAGSSDVYLVKTDAVGDTIWTRTYGGSSGDYGFSVAQTSEGGYIVAGQTLSFGAGLSDFYLIKTDSLGYTGIEEKPLSAKPEAFALSAYPNPFNSAVSITAPEGAEIEIFDVNGRMVEKGTLRPSGTSLDKGGNGHAPLNKGGQGGSYVWQPSENIGSGVYLVRAIRGEQEVTKRIVYLK